MATINFTTPVGRLVAGSLYKAQTTDAEGKPLIVKSGPNAGQPRQDFYFAIAIPKGTEQHWSQTPWGAEIWKKGHGDFPNGQANAPTFAWKIVDGDSQVPNRAGRKPCDREGYKGCWVLNFSSGYAPKIYNRDGTAAIVEPDAVKLGYYIQVNGDVDGNGSLQQPGVFLNHKMVALAAYGEEIFVGPDPSSAGFGAAPLPAGAMSAPPAGFTPPAAPAGPAGPGVGYAGAPVPPSSPAPVAPAAAAPVAPPAVPVTPNHGFVAGPGASARVMLPAANGATYEQLIANGWNDAMLVQHGLMAPPAAAPAPAVAAPPAVVAPPVPAAPIRVMLPAANGATYEQLIASGWNDALLVQHGMMAP